MNTRRNRLTGLLLVFSAITFWLSWFLMPDQGTADTLHILTIVEQSRNAVYYSVILQIISSVAYIPALLLLSTVVVPLRNTTLIGMVLLAVGAMGMCMDAFFHLLAYFMTDAAIQIDSNIINLMTFMQTKGILFLIPLLPPYFIGCLVLSIGLKKTGYVSRLPTITFVIALLLSIFGVMAVNIVLGFGRPILVLTVLGFFAVGQIIAGLEIARHKHIPSD